jgi:hypothetical protein
VRKVRIGQVLALLALAACAESDNTGPAAARSQSISKQDVSAQLSGEQLFAELSRTAPSSAGFAYEDDRLVVYVTNESESTAAIDFVRRAVEQHRILPPGGGRRIGGLSSRKVNYSYTELAERRGRIDELLLGKDLDLQFIDLDERLNAVSLGYSGDSSGLADRIKRDLSLSTDEAHMIAIHRVSRANTDSRRGTSVLVAPFAAASLVVAADTVVGGLITHRKFNATQYKLCTIGFSAKRNGVYGFVTNSHCTEDMFGTGGIYNAFGQPESRTIGAEAVDPFGYTCGVAPPTECRASDAAFIQSNGAVPFRVGVIAKPVSRNTGSLNISSGDPFFRISETGTAVAGMTVEKVGAVTGWTSGGVTHTCVTAMVQQDQWWKRVACADKTLYSADGGDSGAPVFVWLPYSPTEGGNQAALLGIHSSHEWEGNSKYFSRITGIMSDLGGMWEVLGPPPVQMLQAIIWGWSDVLTSSSCQLLYTAHAVGGSGSYTFSAMTTDGTIVSSSTNALVLSFASSGPHWVSVTVSDGTGAQFTATTSVQAEPSHNECYGTPPGNPY